MKEIELSPDFIKKIKQIQSKNRKLYIKIKKQLSLFQTDPQHPSLRIHKLSGKLKNTWSISIDMSYRMIYEISDTYYFFHIGTHDEVYKK
ncbi:hypothetical protein A2752_00855 [Candidatus Uhrbacteria bacterium RIFCSPHIGHO2_01_FULL_46_23]|nr:MAG: hypothetical protein A2752_00855 [Candidatus Uhrbacteria bacterium RIFCSPHIGHO2_01_FULL_46_23]